MAEAIKENEKSWCGVSGEKGVDLNLGLFLGGSTGSECITVEGKSNKVYLCCLKISAAHIKVTLKTATTGI